MSNPFIVIDEISQKLNEINSSISNTLSTINSNVNTINTNVSTVSTNVNTANTNINAIKTATAASTTANASGTLSQKLSWIGNSLIGATGNTGGSATAGTVMGKLNALLVGNGLKKTTISVSGKGTGTVLYLSNILLVTLDCSYLTGGAGSDDSHNMILNTTIDNLTLNLGYGSNAYKDDMYSCVCGTINGISVVKINKKNHSEYDDVVYKTRDSILNIGVKSLKIDKNFGLASDSATVNVVYYQL